MVPSVKKPLLLVGSLAAAILVSTPSVGTGFTTLGGSLGLSTSVNGYQRDVRAFVNGADAVANNNTVPEANFPGALGGALALWKSARAWASDTPTAGKNFDFDWQGTAASPGTSNENTISWIASCGGGTLAFTQSPIADGWTIKVCDEWTWSDGPGSPSFGQIDIQGVMAHELGHSLGLNHAQSNFCSGSCSTVSTMCPAICGNGVSERDLAVDDANGVAALYGSIGASKPKILSLGGNFNPGQTLIINGQNFAATVNVKFTANTSQNTGSIPGVVFNVPSSAGGTQISVNIPVTALDGNVLVWQPNNLLSNAFPINIGSAPPPPPSITNVSPSTVPAFGPTVVTLTGSGFTNASQVNCGGTLLNPPGGFTIESDNTITFFAPTASALGPVNVNVTVPVGGTSNNGSFTYVETSPPAITANNLSIGGSPFSWQFGGPPNHAWFLMIAVNDNTTFPFGAANVLLNGQVYFSGALSNVGLGSVNTVIPSGLGQFTFYSQIVTFDGISALDASNIVETLNFF